jgi:hypothetical protein
MIYTLDFEKLAQKFLNNFDIDPKLKMFDIFNSVKYKINFSSFLFNEVTRKFQSTHVAHTAFISTGRCWWAGWLGDGKN